MVIDGSEGREEGYGTNADYGACTGTMHECRFGTRCVCWYWQWPWQGPWLCNSEHTRPGSQCARAQRKASRCLRRCCQRRSWPGAIAWACTYRAGLAIGERDASCSVGNKASCRNGIRRYTWRQRLCCSNALGADVGRRAGETFRNAADPAIWSAGQPSRARLRV